MAYNLESLVQIIEQILDPDHDQPLWVLDPNKKPQIQILLQKVYFIKDLFENSSSALTGYRRRGLESRIRDIAYHAEDVLESHLLDQLLSCPEGESFIFSPPDLEKLIEDFDSANKDMMSSMEESEMQLKHRLMGGGSELEVIPIAGMGGIGKTTLSRNLYKDRLVSFHFDVRAWATISKDYDVRKILFGLLHQLVSISYGKQSLESRIRDAAHDAEDILESHLSDKILSTRKGGSFMFSPPDLEKVIGELDYAKEEMMNIMNSSQTADSSSPAVSSSRQDPNPKNIIVGVAQDLIQLKGRLTNQPSKALQVIPIVGMGGIGCSLKPSCVIGKPKDEMLGMSNDQLALRLHQALKGRRYLIVLDDMWDIKPWDDTSRFFPDENNGSRIIVTTRESIVADYTGSGSSHHQMNLLKDDESWNLLSQKVFAPGDNCSPELEKVPLSIHVIGGILSQQRHSQDWSKFRIIWAEKDLGRSTSCLRRVCYHRPFSTEDAYISTEQIRLARSLVVDRTRWSVASPVISNLRLLRVLDILRITFHQFPEEILQLVNLRNRYVVLDKLQTLSPVAISEITDRVLETLPNLEKLGIFWDRELDHARDLSALHKLHTLKCTSSFNDDRLLSNLIFPPSLKKLTLRGCRILDHHHVNELGKFPGLEILKLRDCDFKSGKWEGEDAEFCQLQFLLMEDLRLVNWAADDTHFPRLEHLVIRRCRSLEEIPLAIGDIPTLKVIEVQECSPSAVASAREIQQAQLDNGNDNLQVRITQWS
ncbi:UNVERIFIED_CONTAM: putative late blight resistance proteinR1B-13 [Sesamum latifolium]|uniref:Late blight resistance proteinR1B-13 n=1 Tax=Sesamum latifolium TaxID=2727402 RepID=A0AAW2UYH9_9LAMI